MFYSREKFLSFWSDCAPLFLDHEPPRCALYLEGLERRRVKQFFYGEHARGQALAMVGVQKCFENVPIGYNPIGPIVVAHEIASRLQLILDKRQSDLRRRGIPQPCERHRFRLLEGLQQSGGEPRMLINNGAAGVRHNADWEK